MCFLKHLKRERHPFLARAMTMLTNEHHQRPDSPYWRESLDEQVRDALLCFTGCCKYL
jgi:hypothetical protein